MTDASDYWLPDTRGYEVLTPLLGATVVVHMDTTAVTVDLYVNSRGMLLIRTPGVMAELAKMRLGVGCTQ
jgi:hypothetical protein